MVSVLQSVSSANPPRALHQYQLVEVCHLKEMAVC